MGHAPKDVVIYLAMYIEDQGIQSPLAVWNWARCSVLWVGETCEYGGY